MKTLALVLSALLLYTCDEEDPPPPKSAAPEAPKKSEADANTEGEKGAAKKNEASPAPPAAAGSCPAGKWRYDYGDAFMRSFIENNVKNAKLLKTSGSYICEFSAGNKGEASCQAAGGPVINDVSIEQSGMNITVHTEVHGSSKMQFELLPEGKLKVHAGDISKLEMKVSAAINGKEIPFPMKDIVSLIPPGESQMAYKCEGDKLLLLIEAEGLKTEWQTLERVK